MIEIPRTIINMSHSIPRICRAASSQSGWMDWSGKKMNRIVSGIHMVRIMGKVCATQNRQNKSSNFPCPFRIADNNLAIPAKTTEVIKKNGIWKNRCQ
jgi:hypothetical protein